MTRRSTVLALSALLVITAVAMSHAVTAMTPPPPGHPVPADNASARRLVLRGYTAIEQVDPDGSNRKVIADGRFGEPDQTADASRLVLVETTSGRDEGQNLLLWHKLFVAEGNGSNPTRLGGKDVFGSSPRWSPDGRRIAFVRRHGADGRMIASPTVGVVDADGTNEITVTHGDSPDWSPDSQQLSFSANGRVWVTEPHAGARAVAITPPPTEAYYDAKGSRWSPDGTLIAYASGRCLVVVHPDGSGRRDHQCSSKFPTAGGWSPGSRHLAWWESEFHQDANVRWRTDDGTEQIARLAYGVAWTKPSGPMACPRPYWMLGRDGGVFTFGGAKFFGSTGGMRLVQPVLGMAATPTSNGYWLAAGDGGVFTFGDAGFYGSTGGMRLQRPVVGMAATPSGKGYWLVASDGGVFTFGDAEFFGSTGALALRQPIVGMAATPDGDGYWLVASDGGVFTFGKAQFEGSAAFPGLGSPVVATASGLTTDGLFLAAADGQMVALGAARFCGSAKPIALSAPIVGIAAARPRSS